ncbi:MAG: hypothetical protein P4N59_16595 [Negativicutes bacterium]|nr:hypothetical protein [Negativicutes bacterium]
MNKRFFVLAMVLVMMVLLVSVAYAEEPANPVTPVTPVAPVETKAKVTVATIYINNAKSTYDDEITKKLTDRFNAKLAMYDLRPGDKYIEKLNKMGVTDVTTAERADIVQVFTGEGIDYVVYAEVQPPIMKQWVSFFNIGVAATVTIPVKILDIKNNKYLYNGKFTEQADNSSMLGGVGTKAAVIKAMDQILVKTDEILTNRLPVL